MKTFNCKSFVAILAFTGLSLGAKAQFNGGTGTEADPYRIATAAQLAQLATNVKNGATYSGTYFVLTQNIDLAAYGAGFNGGKGWIPIGKWMSFLDNKPFKGVFDGNNKVITGLYINDNTLDYTGLFCYIESGTVKNLGLENVNITAILKLAACRDIFSVWLKTLIFSNFG